MGTTTNTITTTSSTNSTATVATSACVSEPSFLDLEKEKLADLPPIGTPWGRKYLQNALTKSEYGETGVLRMKRFQRENSIENKIPSASAGLKLLDVFAISRSEIYQEMFKHIMDAFTKKIRRCNHAKELIALIEEVFPFLSVPKLRPLATVVFQHAVFTNSERNKIPKPILSRIIEKPFTMKYLPLKIKQEVW